MEFQVIVLFGIQPKCEIIRKPFLVAIHRLVQIAGGDAIQFGQMPVQQDLVTPDHQNPSLDPLCRDQLAACLVMDLGRLTHSNPFHRLTFPLSHIPTFPLGLIVIPTQ
jgi:hypothetical protein